MKSITPTLARDFIRENFTLDANGIMQALDSAGIPADQNWAEEKTIWNFSDGSQLIVSSTDVEIVD